MTDAVLRVSALVVAYGDEPELGDCLDALLASTGVDLDIVIVDNGDRSGHLVRFGDHPRVGIHTPNTNLGFTGGCNLAAEQATGDILVLVNPDAIVAPDAISILAAVCHEPGVGIATASVRLADDPDTMNSAGNPVHYLGLAWAGAHGQAADQHTRRVPVASASGACCAMRADLWRDLGGFDNAYFAYHEDVELSLRCWQRGLSVEYVPEAVALHHYEFSRNTLKNYLLERNRLVTVLTTYSGRTLLVLAIPLLGLELAMLAVAAAGGWLPAKLRGYGWVIAHSRHIWRRHRQLQRERVRSDHDLAAIYSTRFDAGNVPVGAGLRPLNVLSAAYGRVFRRLA